MARVICRSGNDMGVRQAPWEPLYGSNFPQTDYLRHEPQIVRVIAKRKARAG